MSAVERTLPDITEPLGVDDLLVVGATIGMAVALGKLRGWHEYEECVEPVRQTARALEAGAAKLGRGETLQDVWLNAFYAPRLREQAAAVWAKIEWGWGSVRDVERPVLEVVR